MGWKSVMSIDLVNCFSAYNAVRRAPIFALCKYGTE